MPAHGAGGWRTSFAVSGNSSAAASGNCRLEWMADTIHDIPLQRPAELGALLASFAAGL
jgi:hypothetical protein